MKELSAIGADLHIHTALSPCADKEMTPPAIVHEAVRKGLSLIAICDHNSSANAAAVQEAAGDGLTVLAGVEVTTAEEVHVLGIFPDAPAARRVAEDIAAALPVAAPDYFERFGVQLLMDARGQSVGRMEKMLVTASVFSLSEVVNRITNGSGLAIAAHTNRPSFSVISQLGDFPSGVRFSAIEVTARRPEGRIGVLLAQSGFPMVASSDSHRLEDIGSSRTLLRMRRASFDELGMALRGEGGRRIESLVLANA
ncbi:MAG: PHP-associated domain-containing protein [Phycisphaerae bacterium]